MNRRTDAVQLSGRSWYQALALTLWGTRPKMTVVERTSAITPAMSMTIPTGSITCMSASLDCESAAATARPIGQLHNIICNSDMLRGVTQRASRPGLRSASAAGAGGRSAAVGVVAAAADCCSLEQQMEQQRARRAWELRPEARQEPESGARLRRGLGVWGRCA